MNTSLWVHSLGWTLLHFVWQGSLIALLLRATLTCVPSSQAHVRYLLCYGALLLCALGSLATFIFLVENSSNSFGMVAGSIGSLAPDSVSKLSILADKWGNQINPWLGWIVLAWLMGLLAGFFRFGLGLAHVRSLAGGARSLDDVYWMEYIQKLLRELGINQTVRVVCSAAANVPLVVGFLKPVILLPINLFSQLSTEQIECLLAHELVHIRRGDYIANICQVMIESILFYHPAVWWIGAEIRREREYGCDDLVLSTQPDAVLYAKALATLEQSRTASLEKSLSLAASDGSLVQRIRRILGYAAPGGKNLKNSPAMALAHFTTGTALLVLTSSLLLLLTVLNGPSFADASVPILITADSQSYKGEIATADGHVTCRFQDYTLVADRVIYNRKTKAIQGTGHAKLIPPAGNTLLGPEIIIPDYESKPLRATLLRLRVPGVPHGA